MNNLLYNAHTNTVIYMHLPNLSKQARCGIRSIFKVEFKRLEFRVLLLLDWLPCLC